MTETPTQTEPSTYETEGVCDYCSIMSETVLVIETGRDGYIKLCPVHQAIVGDVLSNE